MSDEAEDYPRCPACDTELAGDSCDRCAAEAWAAAPEQRPARMRAALHRLVDRASDTKIAHLFTALVRDEHSSFEPNFGTSERDMRARTSRERRERTSSR